MKTALATTTIGLMLGIMLAVSAPAAMAHDRVNWSLTIGAPFGIPVYSPPPVVYVQPQPVYLRPEPIYVRPQPVYVESAPAYGSIYVNAYGQPYRGDREWNRHHGRRHHRHDDRDWR